MTSSFRALRLSKSDGAPSCAVETLTSSDLMPGDVEVRVEYSTLNYKDGLAITGRAPIVRTWPLTPGIDLAGVVQASESPDFKPGDRVVLNGWGVGEAHHGGLAQRARVKSEWLVRIPDALSTFDAMAIGTAGYTAMLCVMRLQELGVSASDGEILVTGAVGGVGSVAITLLSRLGYKVVASTGRQQEAGYLQALGAARVVNRNELNGDGRPLAKELWAGAIDSVGSRTLANLISHIRYGGVVVSCGMAQGIDLPATVMPFILRGVTLAGVDSVMCPTDLRKAAWARLADEIDLGRLALANQEASLEEAPQLAADLLAGKIRGRVVIDVNN